MSYFRVNEKCNGCLACVENCPAVALAAEDRDGQRVLKHNMTKCARCGQCWRVCPQEAIEFEHLMVSGWDEVVRLDMVYCRICGEPVYSTVYRDHEFGKVYDRQEMTRQPLCQAHRQRQAAAMVRRSTTGSSQPDPGDEEI